LLGGTRDRRFQRSVGNSDFCDVYTGEMFSFFITGDGNDETKQKQENKVHWD